MVQQGDKHESGIMQARGDVPREHVGVTHGRLPYPNEVIGRNEPPYHPIGTDALSPLLLHLEFPCTKQQIVDVIGHARIAVSHDATRSVAEIVEMLGPETFTSSREVELAVERVWDQVADLQGRGGRHWQADNLDGRPRR